MKHLIEADVGRIVHKPTYRIMLAVALIISLACAIRTKNNLWNGLAFVTDQTIALSLGGLILGVIIYLSVYSDEFSSNSMQVLIGRGISRFRLLLSKLLDCIIVTVISFGIYAVFVTILSLVLRPDMSGLEAGFLYSKIVLEAVKTIGYATISMIILYGTSNTAFATLVDVMLLVAGNQIGNLLTYIPVVKFLHPENALFENALDCAKVSVMLGETSFLLRILWEIVKVCVISLLLTYLLFRKKELEFT